MVQLVQSRKGPREGRGQAPGPGPRRWAAGAVSCYRARDTQNLQPVADCRAPSACPEVKKMQSTEAQTSRWQPSVPVIIVSSLLLPPLGIAFLWIRKDIETGK